MKEAGHILRLAALFAIACAAFLVVRQQIVPSGFGKYGHYREGALADNRAHPITYAGRETCAMCHDEALTALGKGKHAGVGCEACHGPQSAHAAGGGQPKPQLPVALQLCVVCHEANSSKPKGFPQVVSKQHYEGGDCKACHQPHQPK